MFRWYRGRSKHLLSWIIFWSDDFWCNGWNACSFPGIIWEKVTYQLGYLVSAKSNRNKCLTNFFPWLWLSVVPSCFDLSDIDGFVSPLCEYMQKVFFCPYVYCLSSRNCIHLSYLLLHSLICALHYATPCRTLESDCFHSIWRVLYLPHITAFTTHAFLWDWYFV